MPKYKAIKGEAISIDGVEYAGSSGWYNDARVQDSKTYYYVIIKNEDKTLRVTRVSRKYVLPPKSQPRNYAEAIIHEHDDVNKKLSQLANLLAKCSVSKEDLPDMIGILANKLERANQHYARKGNQAEYRDVSAITMAFKDAGGGNIDDEIRALYSDSTMSS